MSQAKKLVVSLAIVAGGILAALPFVRHDGSPPARSGSVSEGQLPWRELPAQPLLVVSPDRAEDGGERTSPAARIEAEPSAGSSSAPRVGLPSLPNRYNPIPFGAAEDHAEGDHASEVIAHGGASSNIEPFRWHTIQDGDTLADLAQRYLGDRDRDAEILEWNRDVLHGPQPLPIGVKIRIPPRDR